MKCNAGLRTSDRKFRIGEMAIKVALNGVRMRREEIGKVCNE